MTTALAPDAGQQALHEAAARATLAPSIHVSQPWRFIGRPGFLDLYTDGSRHAAVAEPTSASPRRPLDDVISTGVAASPTGG